MIHRPKNMTVNFANRNDLSRYHFLEPTGTGVFFGALSTTVADGYSSAESLHLNAKSLGSRTYQYLILSSSLGTQLPK